MSNVPLIVSYGKRTVRLIVINGLPMFCAIDICNILGYDRPNKVLGLFCDSSPEYVKMDTVGGPQKFRMIGLDDVRSILVRCRRKKARHLRKWFEERIVPAFPGNPSVPFAVCPCGDCAT